MPEALCHCQRRRLFGLYRQISVTGTSMLDMARGEAMGPLGAAAAPLAWLLIR